MSTYTINRPIWFEGMFLQPQHFQQYDRYLENLIHKKHVVLDDNHWGFAELTLDETLLSIGKLGITACSGIFPDGTHFDIPNIDKSPSAFVIPEGMSKTTLYLALPLRQYGMAEIGQVDKENTYRYQPIKTNITDTIASNETESTEIQVSSLACKIVSEHEDLSNYTYLPIARVLEARANHKIKLDATFMTSWLDLYQEKALSRFVSEVHGLLNHRADMLSGRLTDTQQSGTAEIVDFMLLQLVNKYESFFHYLLNKKPLHPEKLFQVLIKLMGEMATFTNDKRRPIQPPIYQHENLFGTFQPVIKELRHALSMVLEQNAISIELEARSHGLWVGKIHEKELIDTCSFVLAVYADVPTENIRTNFPSQIKIAPVEQIRNLVSKALPGIPVSSLMVAPRQIPYHANFTYFSLDTKHRLLEQLKQSGGIALHVGSSIPGLKMELWAIKG